MLQQKNFKGSVFKESILSRVVANCLKPNCHVSLIASINPSESNYEECLSTLQYLDRTKNIQIKAMQVTQQIKDSEKTPLAMQLEKQVRRLSEENEELRVKMENMEKEFKVRLKDIQKVLNIEVDLEKVSSKAFTKEVQYFKQ